jgi:hypothetical protein
MHEVTFSARRLGAISLFVLAGFTFRRTICLYRRGLIARRGVRVVLFFAALLQRSALNLFLGSKHPRNRRQFKRKMSR